MSRSQLRLSFPSCENKADLHPFGRPGGRRSSRGSRQEQSTSQAGCSVLLPREPPARCWPILRPGGLILPWRSSDDAQEMPEGTRSLLQLCVLLESTAAPAPPPAWVLSAPSIAQVAALARDSCARLLTKLPSGSCRTQGASCSHTTALRTQRPVNRPLRVTPPGALLRWVLRAEVLFPQGFI